MHHGPIRMQNYASFLLNEAYERMLRLGMPESKLVRTGFPVHPKFAAYHQSRDAAQSSLGLAPELFTVLVTSGGVGSGNIEQLVRNIHTAYPQLQLLVVTGRNTALRERLERSGFWPECAYLRLCDEYGRVDGRQRHRNLEGRSRYTDGDAGYASPGYRDTGGWHAGTRQYRFRAEP